LVFCLATACQRTVHGLSSSADRIRVRHQYTPSGMLCMALYVCPSPLVRSPAPTLVMLPPYVLLRLPDHPLFLHSNTYATNFSCAPRPTAHIARSRRTGTVGTRTRAGRTSRSQSTTTRSSAPRAHPSYAPGPKSSGAPNARSEPRRRLALCAAQTRPRRAAQTRPRRAAQTRPRRASRTRQRRAARTRSRLLAPGARSSHAGAHGARI
jgi:hypothetical protein